MIAVFFFEFINGVVAIGPHHLIAEIFSSDIINPILGMNRHHMVADRLGQMAFSHAGSGKQKQGILLGVPA